MLMTKQRIWLVLAVAAATNVFLMLDLPQPIRAVAALLLTGILPGVLAVDLLVGRSGSPPDPWERALYATGASFTSIVIVMLAISYLPGEPNRWLVLAVYDGLLVGLATALLARRDHPNAAGKPCWTFDADWRWMLAGAISLLAIAALLRLTNLGYGDFQGDEARAVLRSAAVLQGHEDALFIHRKGPTEILLPTAVYALTGALTETTARLPFALANLAGIFAVWYLGWRLFHPLAGWMAALFLATDGYFIGFARIVQYQSVVFLMSVLTVLVVYRVMQHPAGLRGYLTLAALFFATGLLSHYEAVLAIIPASYFWVMLYRRNPSGRAPLLAATASATGVGVLLLALFGIPYIANPEFANTFLYLTESRIGGSPPYNNLADAFIRTTLYSTSYAVLLAIGLLLLGMTRIYWRSLPRPAAIVLTILLAVCTAATFWNPAWLTMGGYDWIIVPWLVFFGVVVFAPRLTHAERAVWLWFAGVALLALFLTATPRTHIYTFFIPWMLLIGQMAAILWRRFARWMQVHSGSRMAAGIGVAITTAQILLFGVYAFQMFASRSEVMLNYDILRPQGYWTPFARPNYRAMFGFPLDHGWKTIGELFRTGELSGYFETNEDDVWVPAWYVRNTDRCFREAEWFIESRNLEPPSPRDLERLNERLQQGFEKWARVQVAGNDKLIIYRRTGVQLDAPRDAPNDGLLTYQGETYEAAFDENASPDLPLIYPIVSPQIANPLHVDFDGKVWLEGYALSTTSPLRPGDAFYLTLYWRPQTVLEENYKVFNQMRDSNGAILAQRDGFPACESYLTEQWEPGELIADTYRIPVRDDAGAGTYPLYTGLYSELTGERLPLLGTDGQVVDAEWLLTTIDIELP